MQIGYDNSVYDILLDIILKTKDKNRLESSLDTSWKQATQKRRKENSIRFRILCSSCPSFLTSDWVYTLQTHIHWLIAIHVFSLLQTIFWVLWNKKHGSSLQWKTHLVSLFWEYFCVPAIRKYTASFGPLWTRLVHFTPLRITYLGTTLHQPDRLKGWRTILSLKKIWYFL